MKTKLMILSIVLCSLRTWGQEDPYTLAIKAAIETMDQVSQTSEYLDCANRFERIARAEKNRWLPYYYAAYCLVVMSFDEPDGGKKDQVLDRAQEQLDKAMELEPDESEIHVLQAFLYPSRIMVDPMGRGMTYIGLMNGSLDTARKLNPENPRIYFLDGVNKLNLPPSMGGGTEAARAILEKALGKYEAFSIKNSLWPDWGEDAVRTELEKLQ